MLTITRQDVGEVTILQLAGRLVLETAESPLRPELDGLMAQGRCKVVLNISDVTYVDSMGLGLLVAKFVSLRNRGGDLRFVHVTPRSMRLMAITNLSSVFEVFGTEADAVASFATRSR